MWIYEYFRLVESRLRVTCVLPDELLIMEGLNLENKLFVIHMYIYTCMYTLEICADVLKEPILILNF